MIVLKCSPANETRPLGLHPQYIFYGAVGILFAAYGISQFKWLGLQAGVYAVIGLALLWAALANYLESRKYK